MPESDSDSLSGALAVGTVPIFILRPDPDMLAFRYLWCALLLISSTRADDVVIVEITSDKSTTGKAGIATTVDRLCTYTNSSAPVFLPLTLVPPLARITGSGPATTVAVSETSDGYKAEVTPPTYMTARELKDMLYYDAGDWLKTELESIKTAMNSGYADMAITQVTICVAASGAACASGGPVAASGGVSCDACCPRGTCDSPADASKPVCQACNACHTMGTACPEDSAAASPGSGARCDWIEPGSTTQAHSSLSSHRQFGLPTPCPPSYTPCCEHNDCINHRYCTTDRKCPLGDEPSPSPMCALENINDHVECGENMLMFFFLMQKVDGCWAEHTWWTSSSSTSSAEICCAENTDDCCEINPGVLAGAIIGVIVVLGLAVLSCVACCLFKCCSCCPCNKHNPSKRAVQPA